MKSYPSYENKSGWNKLLPKRSPSSKHRADGSYDYVIIGAGYTGLACARRLAELHPEKTILIIDATEIGESSSGRNSGFVISSPTANNSSNDPKSQTKAKNQILIYKEGLKWLKEIITENNISCDWSEVGKYHAAATARGVKTIKTMQEHWQNLGLETTTFDQDALLEDLGTNYYLYGVYSKDNVFIQPAALIRGLADTLPSNVDLLENTPVLELKNSTSPLVVTKDKTFKAGTLVIANNSFAKSLGFLKNRLITIYTYAALTPVLPEELQKKHGKVKEWGVLPANRLGSTLRKTQDGRFMVRSAYSYEKEQSNEEIKSSLTKYYSQRFPNLPSYEFESIWAGATALTRNGASFFGKLAPFIYGFLGCNGVGVLRGSIYGKLLAEQISGSQSEILSAAMSLCSPSWLPPEPFRKIIVTNAIKYQKKKAGAES